MVEQKKYIINGKEIKVKILSEKEAKIRSEKKMEDMEELKELKREEREKYWRDLKNV